MKPLKIKPLKLSMSVPAFMEKKGMKSCRQLAEFMGWNVVTAWRIKTFQSKVGVPTMADIWEKSGGLVTPNDIVFAWMEQNKK